MRGTVWPIPATGGPPSGAAGGVLGGVYPDPGFARAMATQAAVSALHAAAVLDGGAAGGVLNGVYPNPGFAVDMATQAELDAAIAALQPTAWTTLPLVTGWTAAVPSYFRRLPAINS